jgi:hypothetical protein
MTVTCRPYADADLPRLQAALAGWRWSAAAFREQVMRRPGLRRLPPPEASAGR